MLAVVSYKTNIMYSPESNKEWRKNIEIKVKMGRGGGGQVVSLLAFNSNNLSSNPAQAYSFSCKFVFEINEKTNKWLGMD